MKKVSILALSIITLFMCSYEVNAKDTLYSISKYSEEEYNYIEKSYNSTAVADGYIVSGKHIKKNKIETENKQYQLLINKYNNKGKMVWTYNYESTDTESLDYLAYTYNEKGNIDGYLMAITKLLPQENIEKELVRTTVFVKVDLEGKFVWEKSTNLGNNEKLLKIIPTYNDENKFAGYIAISSNKALLIYYNKDLEKVWQKEENDKSHFSDIENIYENDKVVGYITILNEESSTKLVKYNKSGEDKKVIKEGLEKYLNLKLEEFNNGFILYGLTEDVKLSKGNQSYFIKKYNTNGEELWETIGETAVEKDFLMKLVLIPNSDEFLLQYKNEKDKSIEVIKLDKDGLVKEKIKKLNNQYYILNDFYFNNDILYFVGYNTCPEDDDCGYDTHSLLLVSDKDKVIEVEEDDTTNILLVAIGFIALISIIVFLKNKKAKGTN